jgi:hypothetical protein
MSDSVSPGQKSPGTTDAQPTTDDVSPLVRVATIGIDVDPLANFAEYSAAATVVQTQLERITEVQA